ncbi:MAG: hypothetical protein JSU96_05855 [Acidobacteriota bacterium]|nr:MAG: hypothetical protein JSU96_05855 [Acidobacteriota bacterium]
MVRNKIYTLVGPLSYTRSCIRVFDLETEEVKSATPDLDSLYSFAMAPDGRSLFYSVVDHSNIDIMLVENFR